MAADAFEKFKASVNRGITTISVKTSSSLEKTKIKTHIESINRDIEKAYMTAGEIAYKIWGKGGEDYSVLNEQFIVINNKYREIEELNTQMSEIDERDKQILGNGDVEYAPDMGMGVPKVICPGCGSQFGTDVKFCRQCGTKLVNDFEEKAFEERSFEEPTFQQQSFQQQEQQSQQSQYNQQNQQYQQY